MFGFSLPKLLILIIIIILIWNLFKVIERRKNKSVKERSSFNKFEKNDEALIECSKCGNFYSDDLPKGCPICKNTE